MPPRPSASVANNNDDVPGCTCQKGVGTCPVEGSCLNMNVIYEATVTVALTKERKYLGFLVFDILSSIFIQEG